MILMIIMNCSWPWEPEESGSSSWLHCFFWPPSTLLTKLINQDDDADDDTEDDKTIDETDDENDDVEDCDELHL